MKYSTLLTQFIFLSLVGTKFWFDLAFRDTVQKIV